MAGNARYEYLESRVLSADPVELVQILLQAAQESVEGARRYLREGDIRARVKAINKSIAILAELTGSLNHDAGGEFSHTSHALYDYMMRRLVEANSQQSDPPLAEVSALLATMLEGWMNCTPSTATPAEASQANPSPIFEPSSPAPFEYQEYGSYVPAPPACPAYTPTAPPLPYYTPQTPSAPAVPAYTPYKPAAPAPAYVPFTPPIPAAPAFAPYGSSIQPGAPYGPSLTAASRAPYAPPFTPPAYVSEEYASDAGDAAGSAPHEPRFALSY